MVAFHGVTAYVLVLIQPCRWLGSRRTRRGRCAGNPNSHAVALLPLPKAPALTPSLLGACGPGDTVLLSASLPPSHGDRTLVWGCQSSGPL